MRQENWDQISETVFSTNTLGSKRLDAKRHYVIWAKALDGIWPVGLSSAQHCTGMTKWPNTIQCLCSDDVKSLGIKSSATEVLGSWSLVRCYLLLIVLLFVANCVAIFATICFFGKGGTGTPPLGQGLRSAWLMKGQQFPWKNLKSGSPLLTFWDLSSHICQMFMRLARWGDLHFRKISDLLTRISDFLAQKIWNLVSNGSIWLSRSSY